MEPQFQKYKGRVVLRGDIVKDDSGSYAVFTEQGSSASQMTAAKMLQNYSKFQNRNVQWPRLFWVNASCVLQLLTFNVKNPSIFFNFQNRNTRKNKKKEQRHKEQKTNRKKKKTRTKTEKKGQTKNDQKVKKFNVEKS